MNDPTRVTLTGAANKAALNALADAIDEVIGELRGFSVAMREGAQGELSLPTVSALLAMFAEFHRDNVMVPTRMVAQLRQFQLSMAAASCSCAKCVAERQACNGNLC